MLQHEQTDPPAVSPTIPLPVTAADARVTPDELNAALKALEDQQSNTVAIGSVVDELRLNATPEQIWEQVQRQRTQAATAQASSVQTQASSVQTAVPPMIARSRRQVRWLVALAAVACLVFGGSEMMNSSTNTSGGVKISGQTLTMSGDGVTGPFQVQGKDVVISGNDDVIVLHGKARSVTVTGSDNKLRGDEPKTFSLPGDDNDVEWAGTK